MNECQEDESTREGTYQTSVESEVVTIVRCAVDQIAAAHLKLTEVGVWGRWAMMS